MKTVILFKCHSIDKEILKEYKAIASSCDPSLYEVIMLYDNTKNDFVLTEDIKYFLFNQEDFRKTGYPLMDILPKSSFPDFSHGKNIQWFHADFPILIFYKKHPEYSRYWQIEFDIRFSGSWKSFFTINDRIDADFLGTIICNKSSNPSWGAWNCHNLTIDDNLFLSGVFPMVRLSGKALELIHNELKSGKCGYCELIVPTLINMHGYKIAKIDERLFNKNTLRFGIDIPYSVYNILRLLPQNKDKIFHPIRKSNLHTYCKSTFVTKFYRFLGKTGIYLKTKFPSIYVLLKPYFPDQIQ